MIITKLLVDVILICILISLVVIILVAIYGKDPEFCPTCGCNLSNYSDISIEFHKGYIIKICPECGAEIVYKSNE